MERGTTTRLTSLRGIAALLLLLATLVFAVGATVEQSTAGEASEARSMGAAPSAAASQERGEGGAEAHRDEEVATGEEARGEAAAEPAAEAAAGQAEGANESHEAGSEAILGINPESTTAVAVVVAISFLLVLSLWLRGSAAILALAALFAVAFAAFDGREVLHQIAEARNGLAAIAVLAAGLHVAAAAVAGLAAARGA
jgi:hypothetical protein